MPTPPSQQGPFLGALALASPRSPREARGSRREEKEEAKPLHRKGKPIKNDDDVGGNAARSSEPPRQQGPRRPRRSRAAAAREAALLPALLLLLLITDELRREPQSVGRCFVGLEREKRGSERKVGCERLDSIEKTSPTHVAGGPSTLWPARGMTPRLRLTMIEGTL